MKSRLISDLIPAEQTDRPESFTMLPNFLFTDERFSALSARAKLLYAAMLNRLNLSRQSAQPERWRRQDRVYIHFTVNRAAALLHCSRSTAISTFRELEACGLVNVTRSGCRRPNSYTLQVPTGSAHKQV